MANKAYFTAASVPADAAKIVGDWLRSVRIERYETGLKDYMNTTEEIWGS